VPRDVHIFYRHRWGGENFRNRILKMLPLGIVFSKKRKKLFTKFPGLATSGRYNSAMITDCRKFTTKLTLYWMSSFHFFKCWNSVFTLNCTFRTRKVTTQIFGNVRCPILRIKTNSTPQCWCGRKVFFDAPTGAHHYYLVTRQMATLDAYCQQNKLNWP